jgi:hypothetical protein
VKISNISSQGRWFNIRGNGFSYKKWIEAHGSIDVPEISNLSQLRLTVHELTILQAGDYEMKSEFVEQKESALNLPIEIKQNPYFYTIKNTSGENGAISISGAVISISEGMNLSFSIYPEEGFYLSTYTINDVAQNINPTSTVYTLTNIKQDKNIFVEFSRSI